MSDIVERLREKTVTPFIHGLASELQVKEPTELEIEAAEEITRLRAENEKLEQQVAEFVNRFTEDMFVLRAENERLREALEGMIDLAEAANVMDEPAYNAARKVLESGE